MNRLNIIDALVILTGAKIIMHPVVKNLWLRTSSLALIIRQSRSEPVPEPEPEPECPALPDDTMMIIINKLDMVTLCRFSVALSQDAYLSQVVSVATPLSMSLFTRDHSMFWYGRLINGIISKLVPLVIRTPMWMGVPLILMLGFVDFFVNTPMLLEEMKFIRRLTGLKSLEVELPDFSCVECRARPNLWFKWEAKVGVYGTVDHFVYVFGDVVKASDGGERRRRVIHAVRGLRMAARHTGLHWSTTCLGFEGDSWKTDISITTKDVGRNGGFEMGPRECPLGGKARVRIYHLASTSMFSQSTSDEEAPQVQDVMLLFVAIFRDGDGAVDHDVVKACLGDFDDKGVEVKQETIELRKTVKQILADDNCRLLLDFA